MENLPNATFLLCDSHWGREGLSGGSAWPSRLCSFLHLFTGGAGGWINFVFKCLISPRRFKNWNCYMFHIIGWLWRPNRPHTTFIMENKSNIFLFYYCTSQVINQETQGQTIISMFVWLITVYVILVQNVLLMSGNIFHIKWNGKPTKK